MNTSASTHERLTIHTKVRFGSGRNGRKNLLAVRDEAPDAPAPPRLPRVTRLMALAIKLDGQLARGELRDFADIARLGHVTRARVTQIMNLLLLAPDIQEQILLPPPVARGKDPVKEWQLRPIASVVDWEKQRDLMRKLRTRLPGSVRLGQYNVGS